MVNEALSRDAARLAARLLDEVEKEELDSSMHLHFKFSVECSGLPDSYGFYVPTVLTAEALYEGGEWHWTKVTRLDKLEVMNMQKGP